METETILQKRIIESVCAHLWAIIIIIALLVLIAISAVGYYSEWQWTGLPPTEKRGPKTLWDWLDLLIIPAALTFGALWFRKSEAKLGRDLENRRAQEVALENYLDRMSTLLLDKGLRELEPSTPVLNLARTRTLTILRRLDADRRNHVLRFLRDVQLLGEINNPCGGTENSKGTISELSEKNTISLLRSVTMKKIDLSGAELSEADLRGTNLEGANLSMANLLGANLCDANLIGANLSGANLSGADLSSAVFPTGANMTGAILRGAVAINVNLEKADLEKADLREAVLITANLRWTNLNGANLRRANLRLADLRDAKQVTCNQLKKAKMWDKSHRNMDLGCGAPIPPVPTEEELAPYDFTAEADEL